VANLNPNLKPPAMQELEDFLGRYIKGQPKAIEVLAQCYASFKSGIGKHNERDSKKPIGVFLFLGPSCTGKTGIGCVLAQKFHGTPKAVTLIDCVSFQEKHEISKLIGAPPGYIGHGDKPLLSKEKLYSVIPGHQIRPSESKSSKKEKDEKKDGEREEIGDLFSVFFGTLSEFNLIEKIRRNIDKKLPRLKHSGLSAAELEKIKKELNHQRKVLEARSDTLDISYLESAMQLLQSWKTAQPDKKIKVQGQTAVSKNIPVKVVEKEEPILVIIFDEIEKANESVWKFLLQLMREGRAVLGNGEEVDLSRAFIILTSNIGSKTIGKATKGIAKIGYSSSAGKIDLEKFIKTELKRIFPQEFLNRLDATVVFSILSPKDFQEILELETEEFSFYLQKSHLELTVSQSVKEFILKETAKNPEEQVKALQDCFKKHLINPIGNLIATGQLADKKKITASFDFNKNQVVFTT